MSFSKEIVTHAMLVKAGPTSVRFMGQVIPAAKDAGSSIAFQHGKTLHWYVIENEGIRLQLEEKPRKDHVCELTAHGSGEEATLEIFDAAGPLPQAPLVEPSKPKMRLTQIAYGRTINLGNYENFRLELTVELEPGDNSAEALKLLTETVDAKCAAISKKHQPKPI